MQTLTQEYLVGPTNVLRSTLRGVRGARYPALGGMQGCVLVRTSTHSGRGLIPDTAASVSEISHVRTLTWAKPESIEASEASPLPRTSPRQFLASVWEGGTGAAAAPT